MGEQQVTSLLTLQSGLHMLTGSLRSARSMLGTALRERENAVVREEIERIATALELVEKEAEDVAESLKKKIIAAVTGGGERGI